MPSMSCVFPSVTDRSHSTAKLPNVHPHILIIDSYDSFTYNLAALVLKAVPDAKLHIIKNDQLPFYILEDFMQYFSAIIVGPGPGSPLNSNDIGVVRDLWHLSSDRLLPVFGVCLGLQSLGVEFGATVKKLDVVKHGQLSPIRHSGSGLFEGVPQDSYVVRYHSLHVVPENAPKLEVLAWADDRVDNGKVVMSLRHKFKPFWAVQYHPESVSTDASGLQVVRNFWRLASVWWDTRGTNAKVWDASAEECFGSSWPYPSPPLTKLSQPSQLQVTTRIIPKLQLSVPQIAEALGANDAQMEFIMLDSASQPGRYSIIGCIHPLSPRFTYFLHDDFLTEANGTTSTRHHLGSSTFWMWLSTYMSSREAVGGKMELPFWGGLTGYLSYEFGVGGLHCQPRNTGSRPLLPDAHLVFVDRSVVFDNITGKTYLQSLHAADHEWFTSLISKLEKTSAEKRLSGECLSSGTPTVLLPDKGGYIAKVKAAQEYLFSGDSYELCVTARTRVKVPRSGGDSAQRSWNLYKRLRSVNPAPYAGYLRLGSTTHLSSSPERFLSFFRPPGQRMQLRPIKGTVRKGKDMSFADAEKILRSPKEMGENLMIVDLIRHDLHGVVGDAVNCKEFCSIEEYETLWQMVSVIEGEVPPRTHADSLLGWQALRQCLPPGSMTGAPKKRSVEILQNLEDNERGIYSGVLGYWCVSGAGDWSVVIRSCSKHEDTHGPGVLTQPSADARASPLNALEEKYDEWMIGAGGAITALSDPEAEWDEMIVKLKSVLRAFYD